MSELYSLKNAQKFNWSSVSGNLNPERVSHLENHLLGNKILDAGCGGGAYVEFLSKKGLEVIGIDKHEQFLQVAQNRRETGIYMQGDVTNLPFPDKTFDCTYCFDVLEHVDDQLAIQELARVTTKRLIVAVPKEDEIMKKFNLTFSHYQDKTHLRNYTETSIKDLFLNINYSKILVYQELAVPFQFLTREVVEFNIENIVSNQIRYLCLKMKVKEVLEFKNSTWKSVYCKAREFLTNKLLDEALYKEIYTGLVAVVDLAPL